MKMAIILIFTTMMAGGIRAATPPVPVSPATAKRYHAVKMVKQATLLQARKIVKLVRPWVLTWIPNYTMPGEVTIIQESHDLKNWLTIFRGAANTLSVYPAGSMTFWRAANMVDQPGEPPK